MSITLNDPIIVDETLRSEAQEFANKIEGTRVTGLEIKLSNGETLPLPPLLAEFFERALEAATTHSTRIMSLPDELTTTVAASQLGVSRPTLMKWVRQGKIESHKVGSHHRFKTRDVQRLAQQIRAEKEQAFAALRAIDEQLED